MVWAVIIFYSSTKLGDVLKGNTETEYTDIFRHLYEGVSRSESATDCRRQLLVSVQLVPDQVLDILPRRCGPQLLPQAKYSSQDVVVM